MRSAGSTVIQINEDNLVTVVIFGGAGLALTISVLGFLIFSEQVGLGIAAGAAIALVNFVWQRRALSRMLFLQVPRPAAYTLMRSLLRLSLTALALYALLTSGRISAIGLLAGLSIVVVMIVLCTVFFAIHHTEGD